MTVFIRPRERDAVIQSLSAGVVPAIGLQHIQVGRKDEISAVLTDLDRIEQGGATVRFIIGRYGAGKSFFLNVARMVALERRFVVAQAEITPDRRLHATSGQSRGLYAELMKNLAIRSKPAGGGLSAVVEQWVSSIHHDVISKKGTDEDVARAMYEHLRPLQELVSGFDFVTVVTKYFQAFQSENDALCDASLRWLRAEYGTRTEARADLGVRSIIDDAGIYDYLKLFAAFVRIAGYAGLLVNLDEMGVLSHRLNNRQARDANYEVILRIVNDCIQGTASGIGFLFGGTDSFLDDPRRGLASYEALATRLADNRFAQGGLKDFSGPIIRLANLSAEDMYVLLLRVRDVFASGNPDAPSIPDQAITAFMEHCAQTLGAEFFSTPRDAVKGFVGLLSVLQQNPEARWETLVGSVGLEDSRPGLDPDEDDELTTLKL